ncbi:hypothetical protein CENSYa_0675 [Cenarchaeum symbiosum A]|uniref:Uncharacterized protein n=1 Tax=Cenarchaeum symbiosum (strain A) TaxID=414004 RepID=A0RVE1_CENSY|nr:hypothetical protein CENSYa_0675 [Cenarchaeum symbiosum A]
MDVDGLAVTKGALKEHGFRSAQFRYERGVASRCGAFVTVHVFSSGAITCVGSKSVPRAISCMRDAMKKIGVTEKPPITVRQLLVCGVIRTGWHPVMEGLQDRYEVRREAAFPGVMVRGHGTLARLYLADPVKITCMGPDMGGITRLAAEIYRAIRPGPP